MIATFFSYRCRNYRQVIYSRRLNDRIVDYYNQSKQKGIEKCESREDIDNRIRAGKLFRVRSGRRYIIDRMTHSYPYLTKESRSLLNEIARRFKNKIEGQGLKGSKFIVTSMTRTTQELKKFRRTNINVSDNSPHLNGNAFDVSYARFSFRKLFVTECDKWYLKEALAEVIWQLCEEKRCWATYERKQGCFHVVSR
jgi:uncharacterized protein YcbK (DUF882 family)